SDFLAAYEQLDAYERILSVHIAGKLSGTIESARAAASMLDRPERVRAIDSGSASAAIAMLGLAIQRRLEQGTTDEEVDALVERYRAEAGLVFTLETFEYLVRGGRVGRARGWAGEVLHIKPLLARTGRGRSASSGSTTPLLRLILVLRGFAGEEGPEVWPRLRASPRPDALEAGVESLSGVGPALRKKLAKLGLRTVRDLLLHRPHRYE